MPRSRDVGFILLTALLTTLCGLARAAHAEESKSASNPVEPATATGPIAEGAPGQIPPPRTENEARKALADEARNLMLGGRFEELDSQAAEFIRYESRTRSGYPKISLWHGGVESALESFVVGEGRFAKHAPAHEHVDNWVRANPKSPTAHLAKARLLRREAWDIRGPRFADKVMEEDWKPFREKIDVAAAYLDSRRWIGQADPTWFEQRLQVALEQGMDAQEYWKIFNDGIARDPDFYPLYFAVLRSLYPRWGGSWEQIEKFAMAATQMTSKDEGRSAYARIMWRAFNDHRKEPVTRANWPMFRASFEDLMLKHHDWWNVQNFAYFACEAKDKEKALELVHRVGRRQPDEWDADWYPRCRAWVTADQVAHRLDMTRRSLAFEQRREFRGLLIRFSIGALVTLVLAIGLLRWRRARAKSTSEGSDDAASVSRRLQKLEDEAAQLRRALEDKPRS